MVGVGLLIAVLIRPMVYGRTFVGWDWYNHQWYVWHQAESLKANHFPSLFSFDPTATFNPHYAFYGGTLYAIAGLLTILVGNPGTAMVIVFVLSFVAAYGGWYWLGRQLGLGTWTAHVPSILFVTAPYYLAMIYAAGSFGEFPAVSVLPLLLASALSLLRADCLRLAPAAALAVSVTIFTGSHNLTLLWGGVILLILGAVIVVAVAPARRSLTKRGVGRVAIVAVPALMVNGWFLLPDVVYQSHTIIANWTTLSLNQLQGSMWLVARENVLSLGRSSASPDVPHLALQLPILVWLWILVGVLLCWRSWRSAWFRTIVIMVLAVAGLVVLMESFDLLWGLPKPFNNIQFAYRLETWIVLFSLCAVVGVVVLLGRAGHRRSRWILVLLVIVPYSIFGAVWQLRQQPPSTAPEWTSAAPYYVSGAVPNAMDYGSDDLPISTDQSLPVLIFSAKAERGDKTSISIPAPPGTLVQTNLMTIPELVTLRGARLVAREPQGHAIMKITENQKPGVANLRISAARPWPVVGGWVCTVLGLLGLIAIAVVIGGRRARRTR